MMVIISYITEHCKPLTTAEINMNVTCQSLRSVRQMKTCTSVDTK